VRYGAWLGKPDGSVVSFPDVDAGRAAAVLAPARRRAAAAGSAWLRPGEVRELFAAYGIAMPDQEVADSPSAAAAAARRVGFPVAVKLVSDAVTHKSDVGGVVLRLGDEAEVRDAYAGIESRMRAAGRAEDFGGVIVQSMVAGGVEAIVGMSDDATFGPMIMFGLGGVYVELLQDVVFRLHPITDRDAQELVRGPRGYRLLEGYRGAPPADLRALEELLMRFSQLVGEHPEIAEMDLNPIKALPPGRGCLVVDARIAVRA
jgi:acyl-CoA synthetase (NDP forming)